MRGEAKGLGDRDLLQLKHHADPQASWPVQPSGPAGVRSPGIRRARWLPAARPWSPGSSAGNPGRAPRPGPAAPAAAQPQPAQGRGGSTSSAARRSPGSPRQRRYCRRRREWRRPALDHPVAAALPGRSRGGSRDGIRHPVALVGGEAITRRRRCAPRRRYGVVGPPLWDGCDGPAGGGPGRGRCDRAAFLPDPLALGGESQARAPAMVSSICRCSSSLPPPCSVRLASCCARPRGGLPGDELPLGEAGQGRLALDLSMRRRSASCWLVAGRSPAR